MEPFAHDGHQYIDRDRDPDLGFDGVFAGSVKRLDAQVHLDPAKKQLDFPAALVDLRNGERRKSEVAGQKFQPLAGFQVAVCDAAQRVWIGRGRSARGQNHRVVRDYTRALVHRMRVTPLQAEIGFAARDKERGVERKAMEPFKIDVAAIHYVEGAGLDGQFVEDIDVMHLAVGDADEGGYVAAQVQQGVHLHSGLAFAELGPWKQFQAEIDGGRIQRVQALIQIHAHRFAGIKWPGDAD